MPKWWIEQLVPRNYYDNLFTFCLVLGVVGLIGSAYFFKKVQTRWLKISWGTAFVITLFLTVTLFYAYLVEPNWLHVQTEIVTTPQLQKGQVLKVAVVADFQYKSIASPSYVQHVVNTVNAQKPDLIFLVGDLIESGPEELPLYLPLADLKSTLGNFAILGNHDYAFPSSREDNYQVATEVEGKLEEVGFTVLRNEASLVNFQKNIPIAIGGIDDRWIKAADPQKVAQLVQGYDAPLNLILHHEPDAAAELPEMTKTFTFAGHCHGSQVTIGVLNPLFGLPLFPPYCTILAGKTKGWAPTTDPYTYVTAGVGTGNIRVRLFSPPEISVIEFHGQ